MYFIHYSCYKHIGYVWRGIKTNPKPKNSSAPGPRPPVLKFLDPLLHCIWGGPLSQKNRFLYIGKIQLKSMHPVGIQDITHYKYLVSAEPRRFTYSILIWLWPRLFTKPLYCSIHLHPITSFSKNKYAFGAQLGCCRAFE